VGHGLFCSGFLTTDAGTRASAPTPDFIWLYDCGTRSRRHYLERQLAGFEEQLRVAARRNSHPQMIHTCIISHLDEDHVSGLKGLLGSTRVERIFLPYLTLVDRICLALQHSKLTPGALALAANPAEFLLSVGGANVGQIIYVIEDGSVPPPDTTVQPPEPRTPTDEQVGLHVEFDTLHPRDRRWPDQEEFLEGAHPFGQKVSFMPSNGPVTVAGVWEFAFYNEPRGKPPDSLRKDLRTALAQCRDPNGTFPEDKMDSMLVRLRSLYDEHLGLGGHALSAQQRNRLSLVTYAGPIKGRFNTPFPLWRHRATPPACFCSPTGPTGGCCCGADQGLRLSGERYRSDHTGFLFTGDYPLTGSHPDQVLGHLCKTRLDEVAVLQIPHHGSARSWSEGATNLCSQDFSIFSAASPLWDVAFPVWEKLAQRGRVRVDEKNAACFGGMLVRRVEDPGPLSEGDVHAGRDLWWKHLGAE
jgi:hypothetical protein